MRTWGKDGDMQSSRRFDEILIVDHPEKMSCAPTRMSHFGPLVKYAGRGKESNGPDRLHDLFFL